MSASNVRQFPIARRWRDGTTTTDEYGSAPDPAKLRPWGASQALRQVLAAGDEFVSAGTRALHESHVLDDQNGAA